MKTTIIICAGCGISVEKPNGEIKRNHKLGRLLFCSKSCAVKTRCAEYRKAYVILPERECSLCHSVKPLIDFSPCHSRLDGRHSHCKACTASRMRSRMREPQNKRKYKALRRKRVYGLTPEMEAAFLVKQGGVCAICGAPPPLAVDHCHKTNTIRGLLCGSCNRSIGLMKDNPDNFLRTAAYLTQPPLFKPHKKKRKGYKKPPPQEDQL